MATMAIWTIGDLRPSSVISFSVSTETNHIKTECITLEGF